MVKLKNERGLPVRMFHKGKGYILGPGEEVETDDFVDDMETKKKKKRGR